MIDSHATHLGRSDYRDLFQTEAPAHLDRARPVVAYGDMIGQPEYTAARQGQGQGQGPPRQQQQQRAFAHATRRFGGGDNRQDNSRGSNWRTSEGGSQHQSFSHRGGQHQHQVT